MVITRRPKVVKIRKVHVKVEFDTYSYIDPKQYPSAYWKAADLGSRLRTALNDVAVLKGRIENYKIETSGEWEEAHSPKSNEPLEAALGEKTRIADLDRLDELKTLMSVLDANGASWPEPDVKTWSSGFNHGLNKVMKIIDQRIAQLEKSKPNQSEEQG